MNSTIELLNTGAQSLEVLFAVLGTALSITLCYIVFVATGKGQD